MYIKVLVPNKFQFKAVPTFKSLISADRNEVHYIGAAAAALCTGGGTGT